MTDTWLFTPSPYYQSNPMDVIARATDSRTVTLFADLLPDFKKHARITIDLDDDLCTMYLHTAMRTIEQIIAMCIEPRAFDWSAYNTSASTYALPFRNVTLAAPLVGRSMFSMEPDAAQVTIDAPASWPVTIEVGYPDGDSMPYDIRAAVFQLATSYYEARGTYEMPTAYYDSWVIAQLSRYYVPRC